MPHTNAMQGDEIRITRLNDEDVHVEVRRGGECRAQFVETVREGDHVQVGDLLLRLHTA